MRLRRDHAWWLGLLWVVCMALAIALDLFMVLALKVESISARTWDAEAAHNTLIGAGTLATVGVCYLIRDWRWMLFFTAFLGGHLFAHY